MSEPIEVLLSEDEELLGDADYRCRNLLLTMAGGRSTQRSDRSTVRSRRAKRFADKLRSLPPRGSTACQLGVSALVVMENESGEEAWQVHTTPG